MTKYVELIFEKYSDDVYMVECGHSKHMITMKNCDVLNTLMFFSIMAFNKFEVKYPVDVNFWNEFIDYIYEQRGIKKDIKFSSTLRINFSANKKNEPRLFFSGGKDSVYSQYQIENVPLIQYRVQVYKAPEIIGVETISSNFDNELFHLDKRMMDNLKLELYLPIISPYRITYLGIEKEIWDYGKGMLGYDIKKWVKILKDYGNVVLDSAIKDKYSHEILYWLADLEIPFDHCQATDKGNPNEFCYLCEKCFTYFVQGCWIGDHNFNRDKWIDVHTAMGQNVGDIEAHIIKCHKDKSEFITTEKRYYFLSMWRQFNES